MFRRPFLAAAVTTGTGLLAGCTGSPGGDTGKTTTSGDPQGCPTYREDVESVVCTPDMTDSGDRMTMRPASATGSLPEATVEFTLENTRSGAFRTNFYAWRLHKWVDGEWYYIAPSFWPEPMMELAPGETHSWQLIADNTDLARSIPRAQGTSAITVPGLGGGTYAFGVAGWFEAEDHTEGTAFVTRFDLEGGAIQLSPTPDVEERERDGDKVLVSWPQESGDQITYRVTKLKSVPPDAERVIAEQVIREDALRNALSLFERWAMIVELRTTTAALPQGQSAGERTISYRGTGYRIEVE